MIKKNIWFLGLFLFALLGSILVLIVTRWGPFVSDDSYYYIKPVRDALAGLGFNPSPIFPPGLPLALFPFGWLGLDPLVAVRWLNALLFGVNIVLSGLIMKSMRVSNGFALLAALWVALAENALEAHAWAMSEALCVTFILLSLYLAINYLQKPKLWVLILLALASAAACITRYAAVTIIGTILIGLVFFGPQLKWKKRLLMAFLYGLISLLPVTIYILRSAFILGRPLYYSTYTSQPFTIENVKWYLYNSLSWFIPGRFLRGHELIITGAFLGIIGLFILGWIWAHRGKLNRPTNISPGLYLLFIFVLMNYLLLYFARGLSLLAIYNARYLMPPLLVTLLIIGYLLNRLWLNRGRGIRVVIVIFCIGFTLYYSYRSADFTYRISQTGLGYLNSGWHNSETIPFIEQNPEIPLVATGDIGIYFWTGKLPKSITGFESIEVMHTYICQNNGLLVIMNQMPTSIYQLDEGYVVGDMVLMQEFNDSRIYRCPDASSSDGIQ